MALAPYWIDTPLLKNEFEEWTQDEEARNAMKESAAGKEFLKWGRGWNQHICFKVNWSFQSELQNPTALVAALGSKLLA